MLEFLCPKCRKKLRVDEGLAGKQGRCPVCKATIVIPQPSEALKPSPAAGAAEDEEMPLPTEVLVSPPLPAQPRTPAKSGAPSGSESKPAPQPAPAQTGGPRTKKLLVIGIPAIVILAIIVYWLCFR